MAAIDQAIGRMNVIIGKLRTAAAEHGDGIGQSTPPSRSATRPSSRTAA